MWHLIFPSEYAALFSNPQNPFFRLRTRIYIYVTLRENIFSCSVHLSSNQFPLLNCWWHTYTSCLTCWRIIDTVWPKQERGCASGIDVTPQQLGAKPLKYQDKPRIRRRFDKLAVDCVAYIDDMALVADCSDLRPVMATTMCTHMRKARRQSSQTNVCKTYISTRAYINTLCGNSIL